MKVKLILVLCAFPLFAVGQNLYDIDNITTIDIVFEESDWDAILDTYYANEIDERLPATVTINGEVFDSAGVKFKGNSTYSASNSKNPLNIELDYVYDKLYQDYGTLKLSSGKKDPSFLREVLSYEIGRQYMDMPLSNYAYVAINGMEYGLFSSSESIDGDFVERRLYSDRDNPRFKCNPESIGGDGSSITYYGGDSSLYFNYYELKTTYGWNALADLAYQLYFDVTLIENVLDVDRALWMLAFNDVMANMDSYSGPFRQNYYLIQDDYGRFLPIIWDLNECIGGFEMVDMPGGGGPPSPPDITDLTEADIFLREGDSDFPLIYYLFQVDRYKKMYLAHVKTIYEENLASDQYYTRATEIQAIISSTVSSDPNAIYSSSEFSNNLDNSVGSGMDATYGIHEILDARRAFLAASSEFALIAPTISDVDHSPVQPMSGETIFITATITDADYAHLGYRYERKAPFSKVEMYDDGTHGDGAAGDNVWGASIVATAQDVDYFIYSENADAGKFSPVRAEHEFYSITISSDVVINEIMPKNNGTVTDQDNEYDDWVEIFNNSTSAIDISGYTLSDYELELDRFIFPSGTTIGAGEYLIVWCDGDTLQSGFHTNFKLDSGGETLYLGDGTSTVNQVTFPEVNAGHTFGRYFNGTGPFQRLLPTHGASNTYTTVGLEEVKYFPELNLYPNPSHDFITVDGLEDSELGFIYNLNGAVLQTVKLSSGLNTIDIQTLPIGAYILHFQSLGISMKFSKM